MKPTSVDAAKRRPVAIDPEKLGAALADEVAKHFVRKSDVDALLDMLAAAIDRVAAAEKRIEQLEGKSK